MGDTGGRAAKGSSYSPLNLRFKGVEGAAGWSRCGERGGMGGNTAAGLAAREGRANVDVGLGQGTAVLCESVLGRAPEVLDVSKKSPSRQHESAYAARSKSSPSVGSARQQLIRYFAKQMRLAAGLVPVLNHPRTGSTIVMESVR